MTLPYRDDVVVQQRHRDSPTIFLLGTPAAPDQFIIRSWEGAVSQAIAYAAHQRVCAWYAKGDGEFVRLGCPPIDGWSVFRDGHPHALLIGSEAQATAAIVRLRQHLRQPLVQWHPSAVEPPQSTSTLVIWEVETLDRMQQTLLLMWMDRDVADVQVISIARRPVFPLVLAGTFLQTLYYRLNTVCLVLSDSLTVAVDAESPSRRLLHTVDRERVSGSSGAVPMRSS
jgi:hypothetical protein